MTKKKQAKKVSTRKNTAKPAKKTASKAKTKKAKVVVPAVPQHPTPPPPVQPSGTQLTPQHPPTPPHPPAPVFPTATQPPPISEAQRIWNLLENQRIDLFGLPNQTVKMNCTFAPIDPTRLFLTIRSSAVLPALEALLTPPTGQKPAFTIEQIDKWVVIAPVQVLPKFPGSQQGK